MILDGHFVNTNPSYRAFLEPWSGKPPGRPAVAAVRGPGSITVYVSWNGATNVTSWRVLEGSGPRALTPVASAGWAGFETSVAVPSEPYLAVQALDARGHVLGRSRTLKAG